MYLQYSYIIYTFGLKHSPINTNIDSLVAWTSLLANISNSYLPETPFLEMFSPKEFGFRAPMSAVWLIFKCCHYLVLSIGDVRVCIEIYVSAGRDFTFSIDKLS